MSPEDKETYLRVKGHKQQLSNAGYHPLDDSPFPQYSGYTVSDARAHMTRIITGLRDKYETPEQRNARYEAENRATDRRYAKKEPAKLKKAQKLATLTPKQVAINKCVDLQYYLRTSQYAETRKKYKKEFEDLKAQFGIKSYDLRRQTEYNAEYDN